MRTLKLNRNKRKSIRSKQKGGGFMNDLNSKFNLFSSNLKNRVTGNIFGLKSGFFSMKNNLKSKMCNMGGKTQKRRTRRRIR